MKEQACKFCKECSTCSHVNATFTNQSQTLCPLPIMGLFYRWGVDLCGPFKATVDGNEYIFIAIEHYSKYAVFVPIPAKTAYYTRRAFLAHVLCQFGACAEVVTDRGTEFQGAFEDLLLQACIDHRITSADHPQADGLTERCVQTLKASLTKMVKHIATDGVHEWDEFMHWVALGYRSSPQMSTKISPFELLFARTPVIPPATAEKFSTPLDLELPVKELARQLEVRANWVHQAQAVVGHNLAVAQHKDTLRYARIRNGAYVRQLAKFNVGDFVYMRAPGTLPLGPPNLHSRARDVILRVVEVRGGGTVALMGCDGNTIIQNMQSLTHCHLPNINPAIDVSRATVPKHLPCQVCNYTDKGHTMLLCDACGNGWHIGCLQPPLTQIPPGEWYCPRCSPLLSPPEGTPALPPAADPGPTGQSSRSAPSDHVQPRPATTSHTQLRTAPTASPSATSTLDLNGRVYLRSSTSLKGISTARYATIRITDAPSRNVELHFTDGKVERTSVRAITRYVMPSGFRIPTEAQAPVPVLAITANPLPAMWDLSSERTARLALSTLMPGHWPVGHVHAIMAQGVTFRDSPAPAHPDRIVQLGRLLEVVDFTKLALVVDTWPTNTTLMDTLQHRHPHLLVAPLTSAPWMALHPGPYLDAQAARQLPVVLAAPSPHVLDLLLHLAATHVELMACILAPITYLTLAPSARRSWLQQLAKDDRLRIILGTPVTAGAVQSVWLCVFRTSTLQSMLCSPSGLTPVPA
jgi:hypothetical protein